MPLFWNGVAPAEKPARFVPSDPADPAYNWAQIDDQLRKVRAGGLNQEMVGIESRGSDLP